MAGSAAAPVAVNDDSQPSPAINAAKPTRHNTPRIASCRTAARLMGSRFASSRCATVCRAPRGGRAGSAREARAARFLDVDQEQRDRGRRHARDPRRLADDRSAGCARASRAARSTGPSTSRVVEILRQRHARPHASAARSPRPAARHSPRNARRSRGCPSIARRARRRAPRARATAPTRGMRADVLVGDTGPAQQRVGRCLARERLREGAAGGHVHRPDDDVVQARGFFREPLAPRFELPPALVGQRARARGRRASGASPRCPRAS